MAKKKINTPTIRDRVKELRRVPAGELLANAKNWRTHPKAQQEALRGVLNEIGYASALIARELSDGSLELIDGHLRKDTTPDAIVPVLVLDVTESEAALLLATLDPLSAMAGADPKAIDELLRGVQTADEAVTELLSDIAVAAGVIEPDEGEWPEIVATTSHSIVVRYTDEDEPALKKFVGRDDIPANKFGKLILERIKAIAAD